MDAELLVLLVETFFKVGKVRGGHQLTDLLPQVGVAVKQGGEQVGQLHLVQTFHRHLGTRARDRWVQLQLLCQWRRLACFLRRQMKEVSKAGRRDGGGGRSVVKSQSFSRRRPHPLSPPRQQQSAVRPPCLRESGQLGSLHLLSQGCVVDVWRVGEWD